VGGTRAYLRAVAVTELRYGAVEKVASFQALRSSRHFFANFAVNQTFGREERKGFAKCAKQIPGPRAKLSHYRSLHYSPLPDGGLATRSQVVRCGVSFS
jgi:hypothetical protein